MNKTQAHHHQNQDPITKIQHLVWVLLFEIQRVSNQCIDIKTDTQTFDATKDSVKPFILAWDDISQSAVYSSDTRCFTYSPQNLTQATANQISRADLCYDYITPHEFNPANYTTVPQSTLSQSRQAEMCDGSESDKDNGDGNNNNDDDDDDVDGNDTTSTTTTTFKLNPSSTHTAPLTTSTRRYQRQIQKRLANRTTSLRFPTTNHKDLIFLTRLYSLLHIILLHLQTNTFISLRDLYYSNPTLFGQQEISNHMLAIVQSILRCSREELHIIMADRGLCFGPFTLSIRTITHQQYCPFYINNNTSLPPSTSVTSLSSSQINSLSPLSQTISNTDCSPYRRRLASGDHCGCPQQYYGTLNFSQQPQSLYSFSKAALLSQTSHETSTSTPNRGYLTNTTQGDSFGNDNNQLKHQQSPPSSPPSQHHPPNENTIAQYSINLFPPQSSRLNSISPHSRSRDDNNVQRLGTSTPSSKDQFKLLIVEKEAIFSRLIQQQHHSNHQPFSSSSSTSLTSPPYDNPNYQPITTNNTIFVTSKGYPTITARKFLYNLSLESNYPQQESLHQQQQQPIATSSPLSYDRPISNPPRADLPSSTLNYNQDVNPSPPNSISKFIIVDGDPYGIDICIKYLIGSPAQCLDCPFPLSDIHYIGLRPSLIYKMLQLYLYHEKLLTTNTGGSQNASIHLNDIHKNANPTIIPLAPQIQTLLLNHLTFLFQSMIPSQGNSHRITHPRDERRRSTLSDQDYSDIDTIFYLYKEFWIQNPSLNPSSASFQFIEQSNIQGRQTDGIQRKRATATGSQTRIQSLLFQQLTNEDRTRIKSILSQPFFSSLSSFEGRHSGQPHGHGEIVSKNLKLLKFELEFMLRAGLKCEIEALSTIHQDCLLGYINYMCAQIGEGG